MKLMSQLEGIAHLHARRVMALELAEKYPEKGRECLAEWAGLSDAEDGRWRQYSTLPAIQRAYERGLDDGESILYAHGCLDARRAVMAG